MDELNSNYLRFFMAKKKLKKVHSLEEIEEIKRNQRLLTISIVSCVIYLVILYWIVLFKMRTDLSEITPIRQIILTPFHRKDISSTSKFAEALGNGVLMVPLGVYVSMFFKKMRFFSKKSFQNIWSTDAGGLTWQLQKRRIAMTKMENCFRTRLLRYGCTPRQSRQN